MFIALLPIWPKNVSTVIERAQVFTPLKPNPTFNIAMKLGAKTNYVIRKGNIGAYTFIALPSIRGSVGQEA